MTASIKNASRARWLKKNIAKDDRLIEKYSGFFSTLKKEQDGIHVFLEFLADHFVLGEDGKTLVGKEEKSLKEIELSIKEIKSYLGHLDEHMQTLVIQALFLDGGEKVLKDAGFSLDVYET